MIQHATEDASEGRHGHPLKHPLLVQAREILDARNAHTVAADQTLAELDHEASTGLSPDEMRAAFVAIGDHLATIGSEIEAIRFQLGVLAESAR